MKNKTIWITGASSGIGEALAYEYNRCGFNVILSARNEKKLNEVKASCSHPENAFVLPLDLGDHQSIPNVTAKAFEQFKAIDILVNNGGISQRDLVVNTSFDVDVQLMNINYLGTIALTKAVLPKMLERNSGSIVTVSSLVGKFGTPYRSGYSASKHALHGFFDSLRAEISDKDLHIGIVCPGFIKTNVSVNALVGDGEKSNQMDDAQEKGMSSDLFAKKMKLAIEARRPEVYIGGREVFGVYLKRFFPSIFRRIIAKAKVR